MTRTPVRAIGLALWVTLAVAAPGMTQSAVERPLTLSEAIALALANNEGILVQRESLVAAEAAVNGARARTTRWWRRRVARHREGSVRDESLVTRSRVETS